jgi:hypothetical protein
MACGIQNAAVEAMKFIYLLALAGGYLVWRNRFEIQRRLESEGIKTPTLKGGIGEAVQSVASKVVGKAEHGLNLSENKGQSMDQNLSNQEKKVGNF